jgi:hypothetical protein
VSGDGAAPGAAPERGITIGLAETVTAAALGAIGGLAIWDSLRLGMGWAEDGPMAGFFPFWLGVGLVLASLGNLAYGLRDHGGRKLFITWEQGRHVLSVLAPTAVYIAAIGPLGIYLPSVLLIVYFMVVLGRFPWPAALATGAATAAVFFATFELYFLVPLPKGPVEHALGF